MQERFAAEDYILRAYPFLPFDPQIAETDEGALMMRDVLPVDLPIAAFGFGVRWLNYGGDKDAAEAFFPEPSRLSQIPFLRRLATFETPLKAKRQANLKLQMAGPMTLLHVVRDTYGQPLSLYHPLRSAIITWVKSVALEAVRRARALTDQVIIFLDEPVLGVGGFDVEAQDLLDGMRDLVSTLNESGAETGLHCCSEPPLEWIGALGVDMISFDLVRYPNLLGGVHREFWTKFWRGSRRVVPGIISIDPAKEKVVVQDLVHALKLIDPRRSLAELCRTLVLTPSCGTVLAPMAREEQISAGLAEFASQLAKLWKPET